MSDCLNEIWYILRCPPLKECAIEERIRARYDAVTFVPVKKVRMRTRQGKFEWVNVPALTTYIFVKVNKATRNKITKEITQTYRMMVMGDTEHGSMLVDATVPDKQMVDFIQVAGSNEQRATYIDPSRFEFKDGDRVRVIGGAFVGLEGYYIQTSRKHEKRVVVRLNDQIAVATVAIPAKFVERINRKAAETTDDK